MENPAKRAVEQVRRLATREHAEELAGRIRRAARTLGEPVPDADKPRARRSNIYEPTWTAKDETEAKLLIYNTESEQSFEEGGRRDAARLRPYFDEHSTVLDLGCGIGRVARFVAPDCGRLWAVDISEPMLEFASQRMAQFDNITYLHCNDVEMAAVPSKSVDLAYSLLVLQHLEREDAFLVLEEFRRILKPGGTLYLTFPNLLSDEYLASFVNYAHSGASREPGRARIYTPEEVARILPAAGFSAEIDPGVEITVVAHPV